MYDPTVTDSELSEISSGERPKVNSVVSMDEGSVLRDRYRIGDVVGMGGFGITYSAWDITFEKKVAIKEYFPSGIVTRTEGRTVSVISEFHAENYEHGIERFLQEARDVARFADNPNVVSVIDFFKENGTAYMVMEFLEGGTLKHYMEQAGGRLGMDEARKILFPLMQILEEVHAAGIIHRDISPDNIYICQDQTIKLIDFGAAKTFSAEPGTASVVLKQGYAPVEQYSKNGRIGPWTDVYAFGALMYHMLTGQKPEESVERSLQDELVPPATLNPDIPENMNRVIMKALSVRIEDRYRNMGEMRADLYSPVREQKVGTPVAESRQVSAPVAASKQVATRSRKPLIIAVGLVAAVILAVVLIFSLRGSGDGSGGDTVTKDADKDTKTVADVRAMNEEPKSDTGYVRYGGKDIALADQAVAEDCFFGTYTCTDMEGDALPFEAAVRRQFSYTYESGKMKLTELPLKIEFGRGYYTNGSVLPFYYAVSDSELEECRDSLVRKYGKSDIDILEANYRISSRIYTAELYFGEKTGSSLQGRMLCKYSVTGKTVHFTGITPRDDYSYDPNGFTLDVDYDFKGSHLLISADGKKVEMIPESETRRKDGDTTTVAIDAGALNKNQILDQIVYFHHMEKEGRDNEIMLVFEDGNRARDPEIRFDADGSFTISWKQIATTFDGKDQIVDSAGEVSGAYIGGCTRGMVLVVNDKAYAYTMPKAQYYYETLITE